MARITSSITVAALAGCVLALTAIEARTLRAQTPVQAPVQGPVQAAQAPVVSTDDIDTAVSLLDRIDRIVTNARKEADVSKLTPVGTSGTSGASAMVKVNAADLDEIRAEVAQIKKLLKPTVGNENGGR